MKHTPTTQEPLIDLSTLSLEALSFLLRHKEMWPKDFQWDYSECKQCAMGLAMKLWSDDPNTLESYIILRRSMAMFDFTRPSKLSHVFLFSHYDEGVKSHQITPEIIADGIDAEIKRRAQIPSDR
jgi:hypothetical protein